MDYSINGNWEFTFKKQAPDHSTLRESEYDDIIYLQEDSIERIDLHNENRNVEEFLSPEFGPSIDDEIVSMEGRINEIHEMNPWIRHQHPWSIPPDDTSVFSISETSVYTTEESAKPV